MLKRSRKKFRIDLFLDRVLEMRKEFSIKPSHKRSGDTNSRRIAILANNCFLACGGDIPWASMLERRVYEEVRKENFVCDPIPYEIDWEDNKRRAKDKNWNPLRLASDHLDRINGHHPIIVYLTNQIIAVLEKEEKKNGSAERAPISRNKPKQSVKHRLLVRTAKSEQGNCG